MYTYVYGFPFIFVTYSFIDISKMPTKWEVRLTMLNIVLFILNVGLALTILAYAFGEDYCPSFEANKSLFKELCKY